MTSTLISIIVCIVNIARGENVACPSGEPCIINCTNYGSNGCYGYNIDATNSTSLNLSCDSENQYQGGCQYATIQCPESSLCRINCTDYYGCYLAVINASQNTDLDMICANEDSSCSKAIIIANNSHSANISCYGSGAFSSSSNAACNSINIYGQNSSYLNLKCDGDYSCSYIDLQAITAKSVNVYSRGKYSMYYGTIHGENSNSMNIFCGSEKSEYGCYHSSFYIPSYISRTKPRASINCEGHGCYYYLNIYSKNGALDLEINLNGCNECNSPNECVSSWSFHCDTYYSNYISFYGETCTSPGTTCDCNIATNTIRSNFINDNEKCDIFEADYICPVGQDCIIDCSTKFSDGCYDKIIDATNATSLLIKCESPSSSNYGGCESAHLYCPQGNECHIECPDTNSCDNLEINTNEEYGMVNLTCIEQDSCSYTAIYAPHTDNLLVNCIETDACYQLNIYGDYAKNVTVTCEGDATYSSYSACNNLHIYANFSDQITLICNGDYSCYYSSVNAYHAKNIFIDSMGEYSSYYGSVHGEYVTNSMLIKCQSEYGEYGCYQTAFHIPSKKTNIECQGHGCYYLTLYAVNGFTDISNLTWNGCTECSSFDNCLYYWTIYCGNGYDYEAKMYDSSCNYYHNGYTSYSPVCGCSDFLTRATNTFINTYTLHDDDSCDLLTPDIECGTKDGVDCTPQCSNSNCAGQVISGGDIATSISVECDYYKACQNTKIICPTSINSYCNITCSGGSYACSSLTVYGSPNGNININCTAGSCSSLEIHAEDSNNMQFSCSGRSCSSSTIYATNVNSLDIMCRGSSYSYNSICYSLSVYGKHAEKTNILCDGYEACYYANFHLDNSSNVSIKASGSDGLYNSNIYLSNSSLSNITCIGESSYSNGCYYSNFYIDPSNTILNCYGYGCYQIDLYAKHTEFKDFNKVSFDKGDACSSIDSCISSWSLHSESCNSYSYYGTTLYGTTCSSDICGCDDLVKILRESSMTIEKCKENVPCNYQCNSTANCESFWIKSENASSLSVNCGNSNCKNALINCPLIDGSDCNVTCSSSYSCSGMEIDSDANNNINIFCEAQESCSNMIINANYSQRIDLKCLGSSYYSSQSCYSLDLNAHFAKNINILCDGYKACYGMNVFATQAGEIAVTVGDYYEAIYNGYIHAQQASVLNVDCKSPSSSSYGCYDLSLYIPQDTKSKFNLDCKGFGCNYLLLHSDKGFGNINSINYNLCGCSSNYVSNCISSWHLYCNDLSYYSYSTYDYFYGSSCSYNRCNCQKLLAKVQNGTKQCINNDTWTTAYPTYYNIWTTKSPTPHRLTPNPTYHRTPYPTISNNTPYPSNNEANENSNSGSISSGQLIVIVIGVVVGMICIFGIVLCIYYCRKQQKAKQAVINFNEVINNNEGDDDEAAENVEEIELRPVVPYVQLPMTTGKEGAGINATGGQ